LGEGAQNDRIIGEVVKIPNNLPVLEFYQGSQHCIVRVSGSSTLSISLFVILFFLLLISFQ